MKLLLSSTDFKPKGFLSYFYTPKLILKLTYERVTYLRISASKKYLGYIINTELKSIFIEIFDMKMNLYNKLEVNCKDLPLFKEPKKFYFQNKIFSGYFYICKLNKDFFTELEIFNRKFDIERIIYERNGRYFTYYNEECKFGFETSTLLSNWEVKLVSNRPLFIDHNTRSIYLSNPIKKFDFQVSNFFSIKLHVNRNEVLFSTYKFLIANKSKFINHELTVFFRNEIGNGVGLLREYIYLVGEEIRKDVRLVCIEEFYDINCQYLWFKEDCLEVKDKDFLEFIGVVIGICIRNQCFLPFKFSFIFLESITEQNFSISKIQDLVLQQTFLKIKRGSFLSNNDTALSFNVLSTDNTELSFKDTELSFKDNAVLSTDKELSNNGKCFINSNEESLTLKKYFYEELETQYTSIKSALTLILKDKISSLDLFYLIYTPQVPPNKIFTSVKLINCDLNTKEIVFLKSILENEFTLKKFCLFVSGEISLGSCWVLELVDDVDGFIRSATCIRKVWVCRYTSYEVMNEKVLMSLDCTEGFHKV